MHTRMHATKLVVRDVEKSERFYTAIGLSVVSRNHGGDGEVRQRQTWLATAEGEDPHVLILSQFTALPAPPRPEYPSEVWLCFQVADVDESAEQVRAMGGKVIRGGEDIADHQVRAAVVHDPEGHIVELVGPMKEGDAE